MRMDKAQVDWLTRQYVMDKTGVPADDSDAMLLAEMGEDAAAELRKYTVKQKKVDVHKLGPKKKAEPQRKEIVFGHHVHIQHPVRPPLPPVRLSACPPCSPLSALCRHIASVLRCGRGQSVAVSWRRTLGLLTLGC